MAVQLLEIITWQQLGYHAKPIGVLNVNGFFDPLLGFVEKCIQEVGQLMYTDLYQTVPVA